MADFEGVVPALREAFLARGYTQLTPVQRAVIAPDVASADVLVSAQTGSGKTVAFGLAIAEMLLEGADRLEVSGTPLALVVAPTRELALQISRELMWLYERAGAEIATCVGGMDMRTERRALGRGAHIVVGTPGRLKDHIQRGSLKLDTTKAVVLDEADEMLDLGFREDLEFILGSTPESRRTLLFSATVPPSILGLAETYQRDAVRISTREEKQQHSDIEYRALMVAPGEVENAIVNVLRFYEARNAIVFCGTRAMVNHMTARFNNRGFSVVALSGELSQTERSHALQAMRDGRARVCIATDVAARGIDLPNLELVVHADLPTNGETLKHRSGRTGRAGRKGVSVMIVPMNKRRSAIRVLQGARIKADWAAPPSIDDVISQDNERLLRHDLFDDDVREDERELVTELLAQHGPDKIAAGFLRMIRAGQSAPEDLQTVDVDARGPSRREDARRRDGQKPSPKRDGFSKSVWFSLSVGRKQNAEPKWLLPTLCRAGDLKKTEIGAIRVQNSETFVQLDAECVPRFLAGVGPGKTLEKSIRVTQLDQPPVIDEAGRRPKPSSYADRKRSSGAHTKRPNAGRGAAKPPGASKATEAGRDDTRSDKAEQKPRSATSTKTSGKDGAAPRTAKAPPRFKSKKRSAAGHAASAGARPSRSKRKKKGTLAGAGPGKPSA
ncbi:MAG: DEAD/DEAH box helicase [Pseudomonadota bacterium]